MHGLFRSLVANMIEGVTTGYEKRLEIHGVGYRASKQGNDIELAVGFSHTVRKARPQRDRVRGSHPDEDHDRGIDKELVGPDRRRDPCDQEARALQGQRHPVRRRARAPQGWQGRQEPVRPDSGKGRRTWHRLLRAVEGSSGTGGSGRRSPEPPAGRSRSTGRTGTSTPR